MIKKVRTKGENVLNFYEIAQKRYSCRNYDAAKVVEPEKLAAILESARIAPSACNGQPYLITVCRGDKAKEVARATMSMGLNSFADKAPVLLVISEQPYNKTAGLGAKFKQTDYRSMDIGILSAYITAEATAQGLSTCIIGWLNDKKIREICSLDTPVRLVVTVGYAAEEKERPKRRKELGSLIKYFD